MRTIIAVAAAGLTLSGCMLARGPATTRPGAIDPVAEAVLSAGWLETPLALDNDRVVTVEAYALSTVRRCGDRLEALASKADRNRQVPVSSSVGLLVAGLAFGAATGLVSLAPDGEVKDAALGAIAVTSTTVLGVGAAAGIAAAVSVDGKSAQRTGEITVALQAFAEDWQEVLSDPTHACAAAPDIPDPAAMSRVRAPYSLLAADRGPGLRCVDRPLRDASGARWERVSAYELHGDELNQPRCLLESMGQARLERELRARVMRLDQRCLAPPDRLPDPPVTEGDPGDTSCR